MCVVLCCVVSSILGNGMDLNELVNRHEEGLGLIRSIKAVVELRISEDGGNTWKKTLEYSVLRNGESERFTARYYYAPTSGYSEGKLRVANMFKDFLTVPEGRRSIVYAGLDPEEAPNGPIDVGELGATGRKISGQIDPPQSFGPHGYKSLWLTPVLFLADLRFTLKELCAGSGPRPVERNDDLGRRLYEISVQDPTKVRKYSIFLDPARNYLISRLKIEDAKGRPIEWFGDMSVVDFQEPKNGVFFPKTIRGRTKADSGRVYEVAVSDVVINEPFDDERLHQLEFPPGILVLDTTQGNRFHLWGDGKPAMTFQSLDELRRWKQDKMTSYIRTLRHGDWTEKAAWAFVATAVLVGVLWARRAILGRLKDA